MAGVGAAEQVRVLRGLLSEGSCGIDGARALRELEVAGDAGGFVDLAHPSSADLLNIGMVVVCVCSAALAAGLTMGLVSLDPLDLKVKLIGGSAQDRSYAEKLLPLLDDGDDQEAEEAGGTRAGYQAIGGDEESPGDRRARPRRRCHASRHHFVLVSFLLFNSLANEALPLFLDSLVPSWMAIILSVTLVLFFGEIIPSAIFTGPSQLAIAARMAPVVRLIMFVLSPISWPIAYCLDVCLGHQQLRKYTRDEISALMRVQFDIRNGRKLLRGASTRPDSVGRGEEGIRRSSLSLAGVADPDITTDEVDIVSGVLSTAQLKAAAVMTNIGRVFSLSTDAAMDETTMGAVMGSGFSRIPVYAGADRGDLRGFLIVKRLIALDPEDARPVSSLPIVAPVVIPPDASLLETLNRFQVGHSHMAFVSQNVAATRGALERGEPLQGSARPVGILTLEDIVERILQEDIYDEEDLMLRDVHEVLSAQLQRWRALLASGQVGRGRRERPPAAARLGLEKKSLKLNPRAMEELSTHMSPTLLKHLVQAFRIFDRDADGEITLTELRQVMLSLGQSPTDEELTAMISVVDHDGDGAVDFAEFVEMVGIGIEGGEDHIAEAVAEPDPRGQDAAAQAEDRVVRGLATGWKMLSPRLRGAAEDKAFSNYGATD